MPDFVISPQQITKTETPPLSPDSIEIIFTKEYVYKIVSPRSFLMSGFVSWREKQNSTGIPDRVELEFWCGELNGLMDFLHSDPIIDKYFERMEFGIMEYNGNPCLTIRQAFVKGESARTLIQTRADIYQLRLETIRILVPKWSSLVSEIVSSSKFSDYQKFTMLAMSSLDLVAGDNMFVVTNEKGENAMRLIEFS